MDFELSPEEKAFEAELEAFLRANASPEVMDPNPEQLSQTVDSPAKRAFMKKLAERGWLGMSWPKAYGGRELSGIYDFILTEALSRWGAPQPGKGVGIVGKTLIRRGNEKLKQRVPAADHARRDRVRDRLQRAAGRLRRREHAAARNQGGQAAGASTARRAGPPPRTSRTGTGSGARTDTTVKHKGITLFLIPMNHPGFTIRPIWTIGDERTNEVFFDDVVRARRLRGRAS